MKMSAKLKGAEKYEKILKSMGEKGKRDFAYITKIHAQEIESNAKTNVTVDNGQLKQSISTKPITSLLWRVFTAMPYAAFVEFGTGRKVKVPKGLESYAMQFKGKGIREVNLPARPFLFPAVEKAKKLYINDLKTAIKRLTK